MNDTKYIEYFLTQHGLKLIEIKKMDLRDCYTQHVPDRFFINSLFIQDGIEDYRMTNSPHYEIFSLYRKNGWRWLNKNYKNTKYRKMMKSLGHSGKPPSKIRKLYRSLNKTGYLHGKYRDRFIILLKKPFANTRYGRDIDNNSPEVFSGHHRIGALLALEKYKVLIAFAKDICPGTCFSLGRFHVDMTKGKK